MRTRYLALAGLALALPAASFVPIVLAAGPQAPPSSSARPYDPRNQTNVSEYMVTCLQGNAKYLSRDFPGAIDAYRRAIQMDTKQALGYYLLGEAQLANGNVSEAEASWRQASLVVNDAGLQGRILFVLADVKERQKKWQEARAAWQAYHDWAALQPGAETASADGGAEGGPAQATSDAGAPAYGAFPSSGLSRVQMIDAMIRQDQAYDKVRRNIALSADGGVFSIVDGSPD